MNKYGFAGRLAQIFLTSKLTLLLVLAVLLLGGFAILKTAKEEEPQIKVPMIDIMVAVPGYTPEEIEKRVTDPIEREMSALSKVKHVYSTSMEDVSLITVRFDVGEELETSLVKINHKLQLAQKKIPSTAMAPLIKSYTIDDVPFFAVTFHSSVLSSSEIRSQLLKDIKKLQEINGVADLEFLGGERTVARITPNINALTQYGITVLELKDAVSKASTSFNVGVIRNTKPELFISTGPFMSSVEDIRQIPIGRRTGKMLHLSDVAVVKMDFDDKKSSVLFGENFDNALTVSFTKKKGTNATLLAEKIAEKLALMKDQKIVPDSISYKITRDYGATAKEKSNELLEHLLLATISVMVLIAFAMGVRVSLVVGIAVPVTLAMTLFLYYLLGYTLNRVTLFALIFSIGILVDDAIVVVENIYRHIALKIHKTKHDAILKATDEVGGPTILATLTVILAIMPMAFVGGMMGPYMRPIPIGASLAMIFSLFIAFMISPWASNYLIPDVVKEHAHTEGRIAKIFRSIMKYFLVKRSHALLLFSAVFLLLLGSIALFPSKAVKVKMLPFDNKSEFQVLIDLPPGTTLLESEKFGKEMAKMIAEYKEVTDITLYAGIAAPFNFSGMVKHTFMRSSSRYVDLQVNLQPKGQRDIQSHELVTQIRKEILGKIKPSPDTTIRFLEIPPGPPVMSTLLGEVYADNYKSRRELVEKVEAIYRSTEGVVEVETTHSALEKKLKFVFDRKLGSVYGVPEEYANATLLMGLGDMNFFPLHVGGEEEPVFLRFSLADDVKKSVAGISSLLVPSLEGDKIALRNLVKIQEGYKKEAIHHKDLKPVSYVMAEVADQIESPFYAILAMGDKLKEVTTVFTTLPENLGNGVLKWDGEMEITVEVFKDMGIAFLIAIILIMIIVIAWYNSFILPFVIILPVPLTLIGIIPAHYFLGAFFTATSMIGFIAGAGITVRNSIILVDFIKMKVDEGGKLEDAVIDATIVRFRPILLTALAVLVAGAVILFDPIFQGLAISLMAGSVVSALLSIPLVPVIYYYIKK